MKNERQLNNAIELQAEEHAAESSSPSRHGVRVLSKEAMDISSDEMAIKFPTKDPGDRASLILAESKKSSVKNDVPDKPVRFAWQHGFSNINAKEAFHISRLTIYYIGLLTRPGGNAPLRLVYPVAEICKSAGKEPQRGRPKM